MILSHSLLNDYAICPRRCWHKWIAKDIPKEPKTAAMQHGTDVHEALKTRLEIGTELPKAFGGYEPFIAQIESVLGREGRWEVLVEQKLGMTKDGKPCDFFAPEVWLRGVLDCTLINGDHAWIGDWKTGNVWEDPKELKIHALLLKANWPVVEVITGNYIWLKTNKVGLPYDLSDTERIWTDVQHIHNSIQQYGDRMRLIPVKGPLCKYCPVPKTKCVHR